jgi:putative iron-dependent peroxidase
MLLNMFVGRPEGNYDRLLDVSQAVTGNLFFVPSVPVLESLADDEAADGAAPADTSADGSGEPVPTSSAAAGSHATQSARPAGSGSLNIGSLRGASQDE